MDDSESTPLNEEFPDHSHLPDHAEELVNPDDSSHDQPDVPSKKKESKETTAHLEAFQKAFQEQTDLDAKIQMAIDFMEKSLAQGGTPNFRNFWEARRLGLPLFKENISPAVRSQLWHRYSELSKEARRLKEILDEQSAFAVEQIEMAIQALEKEIEHFDEFAEKAALPDNLVFPQALENHYPRYLDLQKQLNILNVQASRINALRKELLKTEMRVRHKNKFFQRLSAAGDAVFPKRKDFIKQISQLFIEDVNQFIKAHFSSEHSRESLYVLREEIKALQGLAKVLTLNTNAFTQTRTRLSECWDKIKVEEKERKKERAHQKAVFKQNAAALRQHMQEAKEFIEKEEASLADSQHRLDEVAALMRKTDLSRDELKILRDELNEIRKIVQRKSKSEEDAKWHQEQERVRQKQEKFRSLKERAEKLLGQHESLEAEQLIEGRDQLMASIQESALTKTEKVELERLLKPLKDILTEKKEKALLSLSEDDRQALQQLQEILRQRKERRQEIKQQLEVYRKAVGSSSLDFEKAMQLNVQVNEEKERLEKANQGIVEMERKIVELQAKLK